MKFVYKTLLPLFMGMTLISCAGTESSEQTKVEDNPNLFKAGTPFADSLVPKMPELARSMFKGVLDSIPGEYYYHTTDGRVDTLFKKDGEQYEPIVSIAYISLNEQNCYKLKKGNYIYFVKDGLLSGELDFPKYYKAYWNNGKPKVVATGAIYMDNQGVIRMDSGHEEIYFENGKINRQNDWKNKLLIAQKEWNEKDVLIKDLDFPKYAKEYRDDGEPKKIVTGILYRDNQGDIALDSGHDELYFENGKIRLQSNWKDKHFVTQKEWNENGVLIKDIDISKYYKEYWDNGQIKQIATGIIYRDDQGNFKVDSGHLEIYFENGNIQGKINLENKQPVVIKQWNEEGVLIKDIEIPKHLKEYWDNGETRQIATGILYIADQGDVRVDSGHSEIYFENGKLNEKNDWKNKQPVTSKVWNENGMLIRELDYPKSFKEYWDNGKSKAIMTGLLYRDDQGDFQVESGHSESYFENGKKQHQSEWKNKQIITKKEWNENGVLIKEGDISKYYKEYWDSGKPKHILLGMIHGDDQGNFQMDSGHLEIFFENGKINGQFNWKNNQLAAGKQWNESGTLSMEIIDAQTGHVKFYYENGAIQFELTGYKGFNGITFGRTSAGLNRSDENGFAIETGHINAYYDNGKPMVQAQYKEKKLISMKSWREDGSLSEEGDVSKGFYKASFPSGKRSQEISGKFHYDVNSLEIILENATDKRWNEKGILTTEILFPKYAKSYSDGGTLEFEAEGTLYYDDQNEIQVQNGFEKKYYDNGKLKEQKTYKGKKLVGKTVWNEKGIVTISAELPNRYREFNDDGKIKAQATGTIVEEEDSFKIKDGTYNEYDQNGKVTYSATFKDFQKILER